MRKLAILYPAHYEQYTGGAELQVDYLANRAVNENFEVHFIYENNGRIIKNENGLILHPLKRKQVIKGLGQRWVLYRKSIYNELFSINPDVVYTRLGSSWAGFAADYCLRNGVEHIHAIASDNDLTGKIKIGLMRPLDFFEAKYLINGLRKASVIIVQNQIQQKLLSLKFKRNGVVINQMTPLVRESLIIKPTRPIQVLWIGTLKSIKRPDIFVEVTRLLTKRGLECKFLMAGRISKKYEQMIFNHMHQNPQFTFLGELTQEQVFDLLSESHLLINTSDYEGFSNTFVQAWMRKVIVLSMNSNPNEIITREQIGFICPNIDELIEKVELLLNNNLLRDNMAQKAYTYCKVNHSLESNIEKVFSLMR
jgi:glycosyltransferase involved in cell wall biosynthesis